MHPQIAPHRCPRDLKPKEQKVLRSLMRRKFYDCNHPEEGRRYPILFRAFIPADWRGDPTVVLVCRITKPDKKGVFEYVVYSDGLYGRGHYASDKFHSGTMENARASFEEHLVHEVLGAWPWVIHRVRRDARALSRNGGV